MDIPVIVENRLRFRIRWRLLHLLPLPDGYEIGVWSHPALRVAMTPAGFEFNQIDWYSITFSYKRRQVFPGGDGGVEPARLLIGVTAKAWGLIYLGIYLSDWLRMLKLGQLPLEIGQLRPRAQPPNSVQESVNHGSNHHPPLSTD